MRDDIALPPPALTDRHKMLSVQGLRALAALSVVIHHAGYDADTLAAQRGLAPLGLDRFFDLTFGIHLFFVISGFIMVRTARGFGGRGAPWRFLARRLLRIAPLYWSMTCLVLIGAVAAPSLLNVPVDGWRLALGSYLFVPVTRLNGEIRPILGQGWTLNYEMFFYVVFAAAMVLPRRAGLASIAASLIGLVIVGKIAPPSSPPLIVWTDGLLLEFLAGIGVGLGLEAGAKFSAPAAWAIGIAGLGAAILLGPAGEFVGGLDPWIAAGLPASAILAAAVLGPPWPTARPAQRLAILGDASYSLYLTHPFAIRGLRAGWASLPGVPFSPVLFLIIGVAASLALSLVVHRWVERPMTQALHRRFPMTLRAVHRRAGTSRPNL